MDHAAEGIIEYLGGVNGESVSFGDKMVTQKTTLVRLTDVFDWDARPKFLTETYKLYGFKWERDGSLGSIYMSKLPLIVVDLNRLVRLDEGDKTLWKEPIKKKQGQPKSKKKRKAIKLKKKRKLERRAEDANLEAKENDIWDF